MEIAGFTSTGDDNNQPSIIIDDSSISINYDVMGRVDVTFSVLHQDNSPKFYSEFSTGNRQFKGHVVNADFRKIPRTDWYQTNLAIKAIAN